MGEFCPADGLLPRPVLSSPASSQSQTSGTTAAWRLLALLALSFILVDKMGFLPGSGDVLADSPSRALSGADHESLADVINTSSPQGHETEHAEHGHPHEAMFFLIGAVIIGTSVLHLTRLPCFHGLQQTVVLFVLGCCCSLLFEGLHLEEHLGGVGRSYSMWMIIDPHLLLFALLPPLLAGDAMTIDTNIASKVAWQCLYLAVPGVLFNAVLTALFLWFYLPYDWNFLLCLTAGTILCATDPVAVVALLKELGASPVLTVQIQGESLLNDGTAIVLYSLCYGRLQGKTYTNEDIVIFLATTAVYAWILGMIIGGLFFQWIRAAKNKFDHNSGMIQVSLTICCAYFSFVFAEGVLHISGVLATVASSLVLAHKMWPEIVSNEMMLTIWHTFEYLGNTVIFFLAGALTGNIMLRTPAMDYVHLLAIYAMLVLIRSAMIFMSRPLLRFCSATKRPVSLADAAVMSWGGLRGAVGLALAIQVTIDRADGALRTTDADRVLFYVGGVALLTLVINATTCPILVRRLGITQLPEAKRQLMLNIHNQMVKRAEAQAMDPNTRICVKDVLDEMDSHLQGHHHHEPLDPKGDTHSWALTRISSTKSPRNLIMDHQAAAQAFMNAPLKLREKLMRMLPLSLIEDKEHEYSEGVVGTTPTMARMMNETFLKLVKFEYEEQNRRGELSQGQACALLSSVASALSNPAYNIRDLQHILPDHTESSQLRQHMRGSTCSEQLEESRPQTWVHCVVESPTFIVFVIFCIIVNMIFVMLDYYLRPPGQGDSGDVFWFAVEVLFTAIFTVEAALRLADEKLGYFLSIWNLFDFVLVLAGLAGIGLHIAFLEQQSSFGAKEAQLMRIIRVFKALRVLRFVRFIRILKTLKAKFYGKPICLVTSERLQRFELFVAYVKAHRGAQRQLLDQLGRNNATMRVLLQSETLVYKAMANCTLEMQHLSDWLLDEHKTCHASLRALQDLEDDLLRLRACGVLNDSEAESLVHTVHHHMYSLVEQIANMRHGCAQHARFSTRSGAVPSDSGELDFPTMTTEGERRLVRVESSLDYSAGSSRSPVLGKRMQMEGEQDEEQDTSSTRSSGEFAVSPPGSSPQPSRPRSSPSESKSSAERLESSPAVRRRGQQEDDLSSSRHRAASAAVSPQEVLVALEAVAPRSSREQEEDEEEEDEIEEEVAAQMPRPTKFGRSQEEAELEVEEQEQEGEDFEDFEPPCAEPPARDQALEYPVAGQPSSSRGWRQAEARAQLEPDTEEDWDEVEAPRACQPSSTRGSRQAQAQARAQPEADTEEDWDDVEAPRAGQPSSSATWRQAQAQAQVQVQAQARAQPEADTEEDWDDVEAPRASQPSSSRAWRQAQAEAQAQQAQAQAQAEAEAEAEAEALDEEAWESSHAGRPATALSRSRGGARDRARPDEAFAQSPHVGQASSRSRRGLSRPKDMDVEQDEETSDSPYAGQPASSRGRSRSQGRGQGQSQGPGQGQSQGRGQGQSQSQGQRQGQSQSQGKARGWAQDDEAFEPPRAGQPSSSSSRRQALAEEAFNANANSNSPQAGRPTTSSSRRQALAEEAFNANANSNSTQAGRPTTSSSRRQALAEEALNANSSSPHAGRPTTYSSRRQALGEEALNANSSSPHAGRPTTSSGRRQALAEEALNANSNSPQAGRPASSSGRRQALGGEALNVNSNSPHAGRQTSSRARREAQQEAIDSPRTHAGGQPGQPRQPSSSRGGQDARVGRGGGRTWGSPDPEASRVRQQQPRAVPVPADVEEARHHGQRRGTRPAADWEEHPRSSSRARSSRPSEHTHWEAAGPGVWRRSRGPTPTGARTEEDEQSALDHYV